jgi:CBS domain-containing protein
MQEGRIEDLRDRGLFAWRRLRRDLAKRARRTATSRKKLRKRVRTAVRGRIPSIRFIGKEEHSMFDKLINRFMVGFGAGYVLGARAGRERYEQIVAWWEKFAGSPVVRQAAEQGKQLIGEAGEKLTEQIQARQRPERISEVMTPLPSTVKASDTVATAADQMRQLDVGSMVVVDDSGRVTGILTDRDVAIRAVAQGLDPQTTLVGEVASQDLTTLVPTDSVEQAVRVMRDKAIRRLPVVEGDRPVGIVTIGDLAMDRDPRSTLADISAEPPNR